MSKNRVRSIARPVIVLVVACGAIACGGSPTAPPSPVPQPATLQAIALITLGGDFLFLGQTQEFRARGTMSNGDNRELTGGTWSVSPATLGTITAAGQLMAQASGMASVSYTQDGRSGSAQVRTLPNYGRPFAVTMTYQTCTEHGSAFRDWCASYLSTPSVTTFEVRQTRDVVSARLGWGSGLSESLTATVALDGALVLQAQVADGDSAITARYDLNCPTATTLRGTIAFSVLHPETGSRLELSGTIEGTAQASSLRSAQGVVMPGG